MCDLGYYILELIEICLWLLRLQLFSIEYSITFLAFDLWRRMHQDGVVDVLLLFITGSCLLIVFWGYFCSAVFLRIKPSHPVCALNISALCRHNTFLSLKISFYHVKYFNNYIKVHLHLLESWNLHSILWWWCNLEYWHFSARNTEKLLGTAAAFL